MKTHVKILAILKILFGFLVGIPITLFGILVLVFGTALFGSGIVSSGDEKGGMIVGGVVVFSIGLLVLFCALLTLLSIIVGFGLLRYKNWARILAIVLAGITILSSIGSLMSGGGAIFLPFQVAYAAYTLWVLMSQEGTRLFTRNSFYY